MSEAPRRATRGRALIHPTAEHAAAERRSTMHRLKNRTPGIALGGAALGGLVFTGATSASAAT